METADVRTQENRGEKRGNSDAGIAEQRGANDPACVIDVIVSLCLGDVSHQGRADSEIKQPVIAGNRKNQHPNAECRVSEAVKHEGREKNADQHVCPERDPARADVLDDLYEFYAAHRLVYLSPILQRIGES